MPIARAYSVALFGIDGVVVERSMVQLDHEKLIQFSCHVGHSYYGEALLAEQSEELSLFDVEADTVDCVDGALPISLDQVVDLDRQGHEQ